MSDDSKTLSRVEDILSDEDYIPTKPMSRIEKLLLEGGGPGGKLPEVTSDDNGKILKVKDGTWDKGEDISGDKLPQVSSQDNGKVLKVVQGEWNIDEDEGDRLPVVTSSDNGKILTVKNGAWDKGDPEKELPETTSEDSGKALMVNDNGDWSKGVIPDTAITAEASGELCSFSDGSNLPMPKLQVGIEPQQDLHGYDYPWVGGSGKNKLKYPYYASSTTINEVTFTVNDDGTVKVNGTATADASFYLAYTGSDMVLPQGEYTLNGCPSGGSNTTYMLNITNVSTQDTGSGANFTSDGTTSLNIRIIVRANTTASNLLFKPMIRLASVADATFAPYSNICPISGHTEANVTRTWKNLFGGAYNEYFPIHFNEDKIVIASADVPSEGTNPVQIAYYDKNKTLLDYWGLSTQYSAINNRVARSFTLPKEAYYLRYITQSSANYQIEFGETNSVYEPYNGQTYNIQFADGDNPLTVYGGSLDVVSGVLTVDRGYVDLGELTWIYGELQNRFTSTSLSNLIKKVYDPSILKCSALKPDIAPISTTEPAGDGTICGYTNGYIFVRDLAYTDATTFKTAMNGVQLVYELATPITYQLTPTEVKSLLGQNNVWADCGEIESLIYYKQNAEDIADLIETLAPDEKVKQTPTNDGVYDILLSGSTAGSAEATEGAKKSSTYPLKYSTLGNILMVGDSDSSSGGVDIGWAGVPNIGVGKTNSTTGAKNWIRMGMDDISFNANSSGTPETWDGVNTSLKAAIAAAASTGGGVAVPPVIFDNGSLKKVNDVSGFPGLEKVFLTPTGYEALTQAEKEDLSKIYYVSEYEFYSDPDNPVVVRVGANDDIKWFFNGYTFANNARYEVPENLREFQAPLNSGGTRHIRCDSIPYASPDTTEPISSDYFVGWNPSDQLNRMRYSRITSTSASVRNGTVYAVIDPNGGAGQTNPYTDPYDIPGGFTIYYGGKQYTEYEPAKPYVELTQAEYDALPSSKESDGIIYFING